MVNTHTRNGKVWPLEPLLLHDKPENATKNASYSSGVLGNARQNNGRAGSEDQRLTPLLFNWILSRDDSSQSSRSNEKRHILAAADGLNEDTPTAEEASRANTDTTVDSLARVDVLANNVRADSTAAQTNTIVEESNKGGEESG